LLAKTGSINEPFKHDKQAWVQRKIVLGAPWHEALTLMNFAHLSTFNAHGRQKCLNIHPFL
jgi:hypothetical protein